MFTECNLIETLPKQCVTYVLHIFFVENILLKKELKMYFYKHLIIIYNYALRIFQKDIKIKIRRV